MATFRGQGEKLGWRGREQVKSQESVRPYGRVYQEEESDQGLCQVYGPVGRAHVKQVAQQHGGHWELGQTR